MTCASSRARSWQCKPQPQTRRDGFAVEDTVAIALRFANGTLGTFLLSDTAAAPYSWEQPAGENPSYPRLDDEDCYVLAGTHGSLGVPTMRLRTYAGERSWVPTVSHRDGPGGPRRPLGPPTRPFLRRDPRRGPAAGNRPRRAANTSSNARDPRSCGDQANHRRTTRPDSRRQTACKTHVAICS